MRQRLHCYYVFVFVVLFGGDDVVIEGIPIDSTIGQENFMLKMY